MRDSSASCRRPVRHRLGAADLHLPTDAAESLLGYFLLCTEALEGQLQQRGLANLGFNQGCHEQDASPRLGMLM